MKLARLVVVVSCLLSACALLSFSLCVAGDAVAQTKTLKIGLISSVTGPLAPAFKSELIATKPAADLMNQKGGITVKGQKYRIEIVTADDQSAPPGAVSAANRLLQEGVKFIIAPMFIPSTMAIAQICEEAKILRIVPSCSDLTPFGPPNRYAFAARSDVYSVPVEYDKLTTLYPQVKRVAIIRPDDPGARLFTEVTEKEIQKRGMEVVFNEAYRMPTEDFYPMLTKALAQKPDAIQCIFSILPWAKGIINQSRELGFTGPITAASGFGDINMLKEMIDPRYAYDICQALPDVASPKMLPMVKTYGKLVEQETKEKFNFDHLLTLQALWVMVQGIEKAQSFDTDRVVSALETMQSFNAPCGKGRFGGKELIGINRLMMGEVPFSRIAKGGKMEFEFLPVK